MPDHRRYEQFLARQEINVPQNENDERADRPPFRTRAWINPSESAADEFACLVERYPGQHWNRTGTYTGVLAWALDEREAQVFHVWNSDRGDFNVLTATEARALITGLE